MDHIIALLQEAREAASLRSIGVRASPGHDGVENHHPLMEEACESLSKALELFLGVQYLQGIVQRLTRESH